MNACSEKQIPPFLHFALATFEPLSCSLVTLKNGMSSRTLVPEHGLGILPHARSRVGFPTHSNFDMQGVSPISISGRKPRGFPTPHWPINDA